MLTNAFEIFGPSLQDQWANSLWGTAQGPGLSGPDMPSWLWLWLCAGTIHPLPLVWVPQPMWWCKMSQGTDVPDGGGELWWRVLPCCACLWVYIMRVHLMTLYGSYHRWTDSKCWRVFCSTQTEAVRYRGQHSVWDLTAVNIHSVMSLQVQQHSVLYHVISYHVLSHIVYNHIQISNLHFKKWAKFLSKEQRVSYVKGQLFAIQADCSYWPIGAALSFSFGSVWPPSMSLCQFLTIPFHHSCQPV